MSAHNEKDISGMRIGWLVAVRRVGTAVMSSGKKRALWLWQCQCGGSKQAHSGFKGGPFTGCSSCTKQRKALQTASSAPPPGREVVDISGQRFGKLVAVKVVGRGINAKWLCSCDCGGEMTRRACDLWEGHRRDVFQRCPLCRGKRSPTVADLIGYRFGALTVVSLVRRTASGKQWQCRCDCGGEAIKGTSSLRRGKHAGCGNCYAWRMAMLNVVHGGAFGGKSKLYNLWKGMNRRCRDKSDPYYGGKGIAVCPEWLDFGPFQHWAREHGYVNGLSIDRINPNEGYNPKNCEWVTPDENSRRVYRPRIHALLMEAMLGAG